MWIIFCWQRTIKAIITHNCHKNINVAVTTEIEATYEEEVYHVNQHCNRDRDMRVNTCAGTTQTGIERKVVKRRTCR